MRNQDGSHRNQVLGYDPKSDFGIMVIRRMCFVFLIAGNETEQVPAAALCSLCCICMEAMLPGLLPGNSEHRGYKDELLPKAMRALRRLTLAP